MTSRRPNGSLHYDRAEDHRAKGVVIWGEQHPRQAPDREMTTRSPDTLGWQDVSMTRAAKAEGWFSLSVRTW